MSQLSEFEFESESEQGGASDSPSDLGEMADTLEAMMSAIREAPVSQLVISSLSTFASAAYGKLEKGDLAEARLAIDAIGALLPVVHDQIDDGMRRDFEQAITNLKLAYADASSSAS